MGNNGTAVAVANPSAWAAGVETFDTLLTDWQRAAGVGKKPTTRKFHAEVCKTVRLNFMPLHLTPEQISDNDVSEFALRIANFCPSRWNAIVGIFRVIMGRSHHALRYRKLRFRNFVPPSQEQFSALLRECDALPKSKVGLVVRFLCLSGLRISEARGLKWINIHADRIEVPAWVCKNGLPRYVPLLPGMQEVIDRLRAISTSDKVLPVPNVRRGLEKACRRAGLPYLSYHCYRHIFATKCLESGVDTQTVSRWLGHSDGGALLSRTYFHLLDSHSLRMAERVKFSL